MVYTCTICDLKFKRKGMLRIHMSVDHDPLKEEVFACNHCDYRCAREYLLQVHIKTMHPQKELVWKCTLCTQTFKKSRGLSVHIRQRHPEKWPEVAVGGIVQDTNIGHSLKYVDVPSDGDPLTENKSMNEYSSANVKETGSVDVGLHKISKDVVKDPLKQQGDTIFCRPREDPDPLKSKLVEQCKMKYTCTICDLKYKREEWLRKHMRHFHNPLYEQIFTCDQCGYRCVLQDLLKAHYKTVHSPEESVLKCKLCNLKIEGRELEIHSRQRQEEKMQEVAVGSKIMDKKKDDHLRQNADVPSGGCLLKENKSINENVDTNTVNVIETGAGADNVGLHKQSDDSLKQ